MASNFWEYLGLLADPSGTLDGILAGNEADKREEELGESPKFEIPESYTLALSELKKRSKQKMPGYDEAMAGIQQETAANATGAQQLLSGPNAIQATNSLYGDEQAKVQDLGMRASQWQRQQERQYERMLQGQAELETQQWEYNKWVPWQQQKNEIASMYNAGNTAQASGFDTAMGSASTMAGTLSNNGSQVNTTTLDS